LLAYQLLLKTRHSRARSRALSKARPFCQKASGCEIAFYMAVLKEAFPALVLGTHSNLGSALGSGAVNATFNKQAGWNAGQRTGEKLKTRCRSCPRRECKMVSRRLSF
ncbi:hypothetical protein BaRGS_00037578, partial [Batillaria attramentaria]